MQQRVDTQLHAGCNPCQVPTLSKLTACIAMQTHLLLGCHQGVAAELAGRKALGKGGLDIASKHKRLRHACCAECDHRCAGVPIPAPACAAI